VNSCQIVHELRMKETIRFSLFDMKNKTFLEGPPEPCNIARLTQVRMPPHALVKLMRGEAPVLVHDVAAPTIEWDGGGYYVVTVPSSHESVEKIHIQPLEADWNLPYQQQRIRVRRVTVMQRDYVHFDAEMNDHQLAQTMPPIVDETGIDPPIPPSGPACNVEVPRQIRLTVPYTTDDVMFRYKDAGVTPPLPEGVFEQPVPDGVQRRRVTCQQ